VKILVFPFGSAGDMHPLIGLSLALQERGHAVTMAVNGYFKPLVERVGLDFVEQGTREEFLAALSHPDLWSPTKSFGHVFRTGIARALRPQFELIAAQRAKGPLLVVASCLVFGARTARDRLDVPLATVHLQPSVLWSEHDSPILSGMPAWLPSWLKRWQYWVGEKFVIDRTVGPVLNGFRAEQNLPPVGRTTRWWHSPDLNVCLFPDWFAARQPDWPTPLLMTSFPLWDESTVANPSADLERFLAEGEPPIVFAPGSANMHAEAFFRAAVDACEKLQRRGILLTRFAEQLPKTLPVNVQAFDYIPFSQVLPRAAALVHHGGIGTSAQALRAGIPQLVMPLAHDQFDNAARLERLGVACSLPAARFLGPNVAARLAPLLASQPLRDRCATWRNRLVDARPFDDACTAIERLQHVKSL
jgi:rhamnosyltransferase subunit B